MMIVPSDSVERKRGIKIFAIGLRGIPGVPGGIETHAEELYPRLVQLGATVEVFGRRRYRVPEAPRDWHGVQLKWSWSPRKSGAEALLHTFLGILVAAKKRPDVLHIHAVGPALFAPLARAFGLRVVFTHHGQDYKREKWGAGSRVVLRLGERCGIKFANETIVISKGLLDWTRQAFAAYCTLIPNGTPSIQPSSGDLCLRFGLSVGRYVIHVGRFVREKRQLDSIEAFRMGGLAAKGWKLVFVGDSQGGDDFARELRSRAAGDAAIVLTGFLVAAQTQELMRNAGMLVLPSSHEGLPMVLLEAIKHGVPAIASEIPANVEIGLDPRSYFPLGEVRSLSSRMDEVAASRELRSALTRPYASLIRRYDWDGIARTTFRVMHRVATASAVPPNSAWKRLRSGADALTASAGHGPQET
jgi:glycosyltransferase involved in cell wall biosynthesis